MASLIVPFSKVLKKGPTTIGDPNLSFILQHIIEQLLAKVINPSNNNNYAVVERILKNP